MGVFKSRGGIERDKRIKMKIGIFYHEDKVEKKVLEELVAALREKGAECLLFRREEEIDNVDRLIVLGGDGTILHAARRVSALGIPLVGMNFGTLGFLTEFESNDLEGLIKLILNESCAMLHRSMLEVSFRGKNFYCLNELSIMRRRYLTQKDGVVHISVNIDDCPAGEFVSDGLIVATPTGSTAYSLSAGGSIFTPDCEVFLLTPVCAFSLRSRPIACSDKSTLHISFHEGNTLVLHGDGIYLGEVGTDDIITVRKANKNATFLVKEKNDFFRRLTKKIN